MRSAVDPEKLLSDNALINVQKIGEKYYALAETPYLIEVDPKTLEAKDTVSNFILV